MPDELFGPDGTQALQADTPLGDPLGGLVTGAGYAAGGNSAQEQAEVAATRVDVPDAPAAPDQEPLRQLVDKAMMTGPPPNPLRLAALAAQPFAAQAQPAAAQPFAAQPFATRSAAAQSFAAQPSNGQPSTAQPSMGGAFATQPFSTQPLPVLPRPAQPIRRDSPRLPAAGQAEREEQILHAARASLAGRPSLRRNHPVVSGMLRVIVPVAFIVLLLILILRGSGGGGNLSDLF